MHQLNRRFVVLLSLLASAGCGAAQMNETQQRRVSYSLYAAELEGASQHRRPARLLEVARLERMKADRAADNGDERNATLLFERAEADAELARQLARTLDEQEKAGIAWSELGRTEPFGPDRDTEQDQEQHSPGGTL
jgi:hypothetical protein